MSETSTQMKTHLALNTSRLDDSIAFYQAFFGIDPIKVKPGYAKFEIANPPLNFTLNESHSAGETDAAPTVGALNHLGIQVSSSDEVDQAAERLRATGMVTLEERDTDCCYALQDKIWVSDPSGNRWEVFVVKVADTDGSATSTECCEGESCSTEDGDGEQSVVSGEACCEPGCCQVAKSA